MNSQSMWRTKQSFQTREALKCIFRAPSGGGRRAHKDGEEKPRELEENTQAVVCGQEAAQPREGTGRQLRSIYDMRRHHEPPLNRTRRITGNSNNEGAHEPATAGSAQGRRESRVHWTPGLGTAPERQSARGLG